LYDERIARGLVKSSVSTVRGHDYKLYKYVIKYDLRKYSFTDRIVDLWNCFPTCVVKFHLLIFFMRNLDTFWCSQDVITIKQPQPELETEVL